MMKKLTYSLMGVALSASLYAEDKKPNIILVMADDQGYGDMGYTGHPFVKTPHFDEMSKNSVVFDRFYSAAPVCSPTRASVMTGRHPMRTNVPNHGHYMRPHEHTVAEAMKKAGYVTGHFGKWHIGSVQPESPTSPGKIGFDEWETNSNFYDLDPYFAKNGKYVQKKGQGSVITMDSTIEFLKKHKDGDKPMFAVTWFPSPHDPHKEVPVAFPGSEELYKDEEKLRGYFLEITLMDQQVGKLRKALRDMEISDNTIVWYCSDNGGLDPRTSGGREKKGSIYEGGLRVPAMLEWPAKYKNKSVSVPSITSDIYPTLLEIADVKMDEQPQLDGVSLLPVINGTQKYRPAMGFWHNYTGGQPTWGDAIIKQLKEAQEAGKPTPYEGRLLKNVNEFPARDKANLNGHAALTQWPWKIHRIVQAERYNKKGKLVKPAMNKLELYNLVDDPMEETNVFDTEPHKAKEMLQALTQWQHSVLESWEGKDYKTK